MRTALFLVFMGLSGFLPACSSDTSTPELCQRACEAWDACTGEEGWYPFATCMSDCQQEGDWDQGYAECLERYTTCQDMESHCG